MAGKNKNVFVSSLGGAGNGKGATSSLFPLLVCFSLGAVIILVAAVFFQLQLLSLRREVAALEINLTGCEMERLKSPRKRSAERDQAEFGQGIRAAHLQGAHPLQHIKNRGKIGPWSLSTTEPAFFTLRKKNTEIEISRSGLYYLYAQIYYLTSESHNSFQILTYNGTEPRKNHRNVATCAASGRETVGEVSCHTAFTGSFRSGDRLYLHQVEQNRIIHFAKGCSYFGVILLKEKGTTKRRTQGRVPDKS